MHGGMQSYDKFEAARSFLTLDAGVQAGLGSIHLVQCDQAYKSGYTSTMNSQSKAVQIE